MPYYIYNWRNIEPNHHGLSQKQLIEHFLSQGNIKKLREMHTRLRSQEVCVIADEPIEQPNFMLITTTEATYDYYCARHAILSGGGRNYHEQGEAEFYLEINDGCLIRFVTCHGETSYRDQPLRIFDFSGRQTKSAGSEWAAWKKHSIVANKRNDGVQEAQAKVAEEIPPTVGSCSMM